MKSGSAYAIKSYLNSKKPREGPDCRLDLNAVQVNSFCVIYYVQGQTLSVLEE